MELFELRTFLAVVTEGSFSRAATRLQRTQPAVSRTIRSLEVELGQPLFDRSSNPGTLTEAGAVLQSYAERLLRLTEEAEASIHEIDDLRRGRVAIGSNDTGIPVLLPLIAAFQAKHPKILLDIRRVHARHIPAEVLHGRLDFGFMTFQPTDSRLFDISLGNDDLVAIVYPHHRFAGRAKITLLEWAQEPIIVHSEPSPARERVGQVLESRNSTMNVRMAIPSLDGIKLAVEAEMGISLLPRRCVINEVRRKQLVAVPIPELRLPRHMRLVHRRGSRLSHAATAFLQVATGYVHGESPSADRGLRAHRASRRGVHRE
jgi:DNA-binding transcriptional LysR family regulator